MEEHGHIVGRRREIAYGRHTTRLVQQAVYLHVGAVVDRQPVDAFPLQWHLHFDTVEKHKDFLAWGDGDGRVAVHQVVVGERGTRLESPARSLPERNVTTRRHEICTEMHNQLTIRSNLFSLFVIKKQRSQQMKHWQSSL